MANPIAAMVLAEQANLSQALQQQHHNYISGKVRYVYNPLEYAWDPFSNYVKKYCHEIKVLFVGMNPGPFGMGQNGVPFGNMEHVNLLGISGVVHQPEIMHPKRPVLGFNATRMEESGYRLWGLIFNLCNPEYFFKRCFVCNYCPLMFLGQSGRNIPLNLLPVATRRLFEPFCDSALLHLINVTKAEIVVGIGVYAAEAAERTLQNAGKQNIPVVKITHPAAHYVTDPYTQRRIFLTRERWATHVTQQLKDGNVYSYMNQWNR